MSCTPWWALARPSRPYSVVLLDEIEKAHPDVFNILLQVFEDGRLTDGHGRTVSFRNTVIIMTSNLGSELIQEIASADDYGEDNYGAMKTTVMQVVGQHFRPEFINRLDEVVVFHPLGREQIRAIARIQVEDLGQRLRDNAMELVVSEAVLDKLGEIGFDPVYGARPIKRAVLQYLGNNLAQEILAGRFGRGDTIHVDWEGDGVVFGGMP